VDALMAALVLGALTQLGDRTPWLAAILADRFRSPATLIVAAAVALALNNAVGTIGGVLVAKLLTPNAKLLLLALALVLAGLTVQLGRKSPDRLSGWRLGAFGTSVTGLAILAFGDRMQFVTAALAARTTLPWAAPVGATLGALAVCVPAIVLGEERWLALPLKPVKIVSGVVLGLSAVGLVGS
jgi:putative Ca2+/H+ antiporter (TMEM165/GDT1 family)